MSQELRDDTQANPYTLATITNVDDGDVFVVIEGGTPTSAMPTHTFVQSAKHMSSLEGKQVLLAFVETKPVIIDLVYQQMSDELADDHAMPANTSELRTNIDGHRITLKASRSLMLECGRSSIELSADGKIAIRGERMVSKVRGAQVIRGGSIKLN